MLFGAAIYGYGKCDVLELIEWMKNKWILGLKKSPRTVILEEGTKLEKIGQIAASLALKFDEKIRMSENKLLKEYQRGKLTGSAWPEERKRYFQRTGYSEIIIAGRLRGWETMWIELKEADIRVNEQLRYNR